MGHPNGLRVAEEIALEQVAPKFQTALHHGFRVDFFGDELLAGKAPEDVPLQFLGCEREDIQLDVIRQMKCGCEFAVEGEIVERDAIAAALQILDAFQEIVVQIDVFENLQHAAIRRYDGLRKQDAAGTIDEQQFVTGDLVDTDIDRGVQQHLRGGNGPVMHIGVRDIPMAIEEFVPVHPALSVVDRLACQKYIHTALIGTETGIL